MTLPRWQDLRRSRLAKRCSRVKWKRNSPRYVQSSFAVIASADRPAFQRLTTWFSNSASAANNGGIRRLDSWLPLLRRLHQIRNPRPRRRTTVQQFMLDHPDLINAVFLHRYGDAKGLTNTQRINERNALAKSLLAGQCSNLVSGLDKKAADQHKATLNQWNLILDDISSAQNVSKYVLPLPFSWVPLTHIYTCRARDTLFDAVHPLLQAIGSYANCYVSLIAGNTETREDDTEFFTA